MHDDAPLEGRKLLHLWRGMEKLSGNFVTFWLIFLHYLNIIYHIFIYDIFIYFIYSDNFSKYS